MDLYKTIRSLYDEKKRLDRLIQSLENIEPPEGAGGRQPKSRRGRKSMSAEERLRVSERMRTYWARKRGERVPDA